MRGDNGQFLRPGAILTFLWGADEESREMEKDRKIATIQLAVQVFVLDGLPLVRYSMLGV